METVPSRTGSYAKRRKVFKDVWGSSETNKENVNPMKPAIIRTARIGNEDVISKRKKQRIRHLRTVCKKILHFCDREENDIYGRMASARTEKEIEEFFKAFKPNIEPPSSEIIPTDLSNETSSSKNDYEFKFSNSTQNKTNRSINTDSVKTNNQGKKPKAVCNMDYIKSPTPREVYRMHTIHIPRLL